MSSNRRILPLQSSSSQSSSSNPVETSPDAGQNGNVNGMLTSSGSGESGDSGSRDEHSRKRRTPGLVAAIACTECRRARQKPHTKIHKESLLKEIHNLRRDNTRLRTENQQAEGAANDLEHKNRGLLEIYDWQRTILDTIGSNGHDREIIKRLRAGETTKTIAEWLGEQRPIQHNLHVVPDGSHGLLDIVHAFEEQLRRDDGQGVGRESDTLQFGWTAVSSSQTLLGHLFDLYFTWVHPVHMLFSEKDFRDSYTNHNATYCSSALVNAICAMACHLMDPNDDTAGDVDVDTLTTGFMNQARQEVKPQNYMHLTSVQALAVMYLADLSSGKARSATGYLRASVEFLKAAELDGQSAQAREISLWGIQTLNTSSTGITYQKLYAPELPHMAKFRHVDLHNHHSVWQEYRSIGDQRYLPVRPSHAVLTACHQAGLFRIIHESLNLYCGLRGLVRADAVLALYRRYMDWEEDLPFILKAIGDEAQPLPHILLLHVQFHVAVVQHLTPLLQSNLFDGPNLDELRRLVVKHAQEGIVILEHMHQLYTGRFLMPLLSFCTIHLGDPLVRYSPDDPPAANVVEFCLGLLQQASPGFPINGPLQELFRRTAVECGASLPPNVEQLTGQLGNYGMDDILDACTRLDYKQPVDQSVRHVDENIADDWPSKWEQIVDGPERPQSPDSTRKASPSEKHLRIESLLKR
ncbi:MAG: hypothetical protein LQ344_007565 [Seirophora lacunosa]|nr:MAG: hypothetical protein LQ344_007565 [Seirophora lacunosa]